MTPSWPWTDGALLRPTGGNPLLGLTLLALLASCGDDGAATPRAGRVDVARTTNTAAAKPEDFCDIYYPGASGPTLVPARAVAYQGGPAPALPAGRWIWLNVWATWCKPCMRELPLLARWADVLQREGVPVELWFYSVDQDAVALAAFAAANPAVARATSVRLVDREAFVAWLATLKLPAESTIPINLLATPDGHVRCLRTGGLEEEHYAHVKGLLLAR